MKAKTKRPVAAKTAATGRKRSESTLTLTSKEALRAMVSLLEHENARVSSAAYEAVVAQFRARDRRPSDDRLRREIVQAVVENGGRLAERSDAESAPAIAYFVSKLRAELEWLHSNYDDASFTTAHLDDATLSVVLAAFRPRPRGRGRPRNGSPISRPAALAALLRQLRMTPMDARGIEALLDPRRGRTSLEFESHEERVRKTKEILQRSEQRGKPRR